MFQASFAPSTIMDERRRGVQPGRVSLRKLPPMHSTIISGRIDKASEVKAMELYEEKQSDPLPCHGPGEIPGTPHHAMEFLSRTWSPSSSDFFRLLSSNGLVPRLEDDTLEEHDDILENQHATNKKLQCNRRTTMRMDQKWIKLGGVKSWLKGELLGKFSKGLKTKKKEELRLHMAQVHAAVSVARLAAAVSGIVANCSLEPSDHRMMSNTGSIRRECDSQLSAAVVSAAALVATVCAEAAEMAGANRSLISSAISSGLATRTSTDVLTLTATAATCLRGAAAVEVGAATRVCVSKDYNRLPNGAQVLISTTAGKVELRMAWIYLKQDKLILRLGKKHMGGILTKYEEFEILHAMEDGEEGGFAKDDRGLYSLMVDTSEGAIQLLLQDDDQYAAWKSTISHLSSKINNTR